MGAYIATLSSPGTWRTIDSEVVKTKLKRSVQLLVKATAVKIIVLYRYIIIDIMKYFKSEFD